jgi:imidazolonepropionase-like amidohydrolase
MPADKSDRPDTILTYGATMKTSLQKLLAGFSSLCLIHASSIVSLHAQTTPAMGLRQNTPTVHAFTNARIVQAPGTTIEGATLIIRDGLISSVGSASIPQDARIWDMKGMTIYPGLIDAYSDYGMPKPRLGTQEATQPQELRPAETRGASSWTDAVLAQQNAAELFSPDTKTAETIRSQGFTTTLVVPKNGNLKGTSTLVNLGDRKPNDVILRSSVAHHISLAVDPRREAYPTSLMGVIALVRQTLLDADWYQKAFKAYRKKPSLPRPETNEPLAALKDVPGGAMPVVIETSDELDFLRAQAIGIEFGLNLIVLGSGYEYRQLQAVAQSKRDVILPLNFPETPSVQTPEEALDVSLADLRHWDEAPENPKRLQEAGVHFALTSALLKDKRMFLIQLRKAVRRGLREDAALAALTTTPARMFGVENRLGSLEPGKLANFVITNGDLFAEKTAIREVWIDGIRYEVTPAPDVDPRGTWSLVLAGEAPGDTTSLKIRGEPDELQGAVKRKKEVKLSALNISASRLMLTFPGDSLGYPGIVRMTAIVSAQKLEGSGEWPDGKPFSFSGTRVSPFVNEPDTTTQRTVSPALFPQVSPPGEFGREAVPAQYPVVLVKNATVWTCGPEGKIEEGDVLIEKGKIKKIGKNIGAPAGATIIDAKGRHITPGVIDAHSHMAESGDVNEATRAVSAEVRMTDIIDHRDISIYRALAGGTTEVHVLHGSANPIGGQGQLIKLRWGMPPEGLKFEGAPPTIKFALGENVKQANWPEGSAKRYPQTRMGVEQTMRDEFKAALDYERAWKQFEEDGSGIPPRRNLELDAILEVLHGKRLVNCHAYRQDEILMMMRLAEDCGFRIRTFEHILEGYKVADIMAKLGVGGSTFSDWWGYKLEVYDAIPYNGALMHDQGVLVSFNSDSDELSRRLNWDAAKAMKYGGLAEEEALKLVTINPARQLGVDRRVGSLEPGKDADLVIWSGNPLSVYTRCEQTWIDGRKYFDREEDRRLYAEGQRQRAMLVQKALLTKKTPAPSTGAVMPVGGGDRSMRDQESAGGEGQQ